MNVGLRIAQLRKEHGYSRVEFANKIGIPHTTLRNYETGIREPGHTFLLKMAKEFDVSTDYLLGLTDQKSSSEQLFKLSDEAYRIARAYDNANAKDQKVIRQILDIEDE